MFLHYILAHLSGVQCLWVSRVISGVLGSTCVVWYQAEVIVGMVWQLRPVWHWARGIISVYLAHVAPARDPLTCGPFIFLISIFF